MDLIRLALLDAGSGKLEPVESDPENAWIFQDAVFSELSDELDGHHLPGRRDSATYWKDKAFEADYRATEASCRDKEIRYGSRTRTSGCGW